MVPGVAGQADVGDYVYLRAGIGTSTAPPRPGFRPRPLRLCEASARGPDKPAGSWISNLSARAGSAVVARRWRCTRRWRYLRGGRPGSHQVTMSVQSRSEPCSQPRVAPGWPTCPGNDISVDLSVGQATQGRPALSVSWRDLLGGRCVRWVVVLSPGDYAVRVRSLRGNRPADTHYRYGGSAHRDGRVAAHEALVPGHREQSRHGLSGSPASRRCGGHRRR